MIDGTYYLNIGEVRKIKDPGPIPDGLMYYATVRRSDPGTPKHIIVAEGKDAYGGSIPRTLEITACGRVIGAYPILYAQMDENFVCIACQRRVSVADANKAVRARVDGLNARSEAYFAAERKEAAEQQSKLKDVAEFIGAAGIDYTINDTFVSATIAGHRVNIRLGDE